MMNTKKSYLSYFIWILFSVLDCVCLSFYLITGVFSKTFTKTSWIVGGVCIVFFVMILLFVIIRKISASVAKRMSYSVQEKEEYKILDITFPVLILAATAGRLTYYVVHHLPIVIKDGTYYYQALVTERHNSLIFALHGLTACYTNSLHLLFLLFGNNPITGIVFQVTLFIASLLLLYISIRIIAGIVPACVTMGGLAFLPGTLQHVFSLTPEMMEIFLLSTGLFMVALLAKSFETKTKEKKSSYLSFLLAGVYISLLAYIDLYNVVLLLFVFSLYFLKNEKSSHMWVIRLIFFEFTGLFIGIAIMLAIIYLNGQDVVEYLTSWSELYFSNIQLAYLPIPPEATLAGCLILLILGFYNILGFMTLRRNHLGSFGLCLIVVMALPALSINYVDYQLLNTLIWSIVAGVGVQALYIQESNVNTDEVIQRDEEFENLDDFEEDEDMILKTETTDLPEKVKMIDNPLPLPKKHVRKQMDYSLNVSPDKMAFDHEVGEQDDYDYIK